MDASKPKFGQKNLIYTGVGVCIFAGLVLFYQYVMRPSGSSVTQNALPTHLPANKPSPTRIVQNVPLSPVNVPPSWNAQKDTRYAIAYPSDWKNSQDPAQGRDVYMTFQPQAASSEAFPIFVVQVYPVNTVSVQQRITELAPLQLQQTSIEFRGNQAVRLSGILPLVFPTGNPEKKPIIKTYILFERNNRLYTVDYAYFQDENEQKNQQLFDQMISTLALPQ